MALIGIYERLGSQLDDKVYPILLLGSIGLWHWLSWRLFFDLIALPEVHRSKVNREVITKKSAFSFLIPIGYLLLALCIFNFYASPKYAHAATGVRYGLIAIGLGLLGQMLAVVRFLISEKFKDEQRA